MSDPAIEAAQRAWESEAWARPGVPVEKGMSEGDLAIAAAREALTPIRDLHKPGPEYLNDNPYSPDKVLRDCCECEDYWPCATALLAYTSDEIGNAK